MNRAVRLFCIKIELLALLTACSPVHLLESTPTGAALRTESRPPGATMTPSRVRSLAPSATLPASLKPTKTVTPVQTIPPTATTEPTLAPPGQKQPIPQGIFYLGDKTSLAIGFNMNAGGAIGSLLFNGRELIDREDFGRYFQLSYYDGDQTYHARGNDPYGDWGWNPIQAGSKGYKGAQVLEFRTTDKGVYIKALGKEWGKNDLDSDMTFETWAWQHDSYFEIHTRSTHTGADSHGSGEQEFPAAYFSTSLTRQFGYFGDAPFTGQPVANIRQIGYPFCPTVTPTENWVAFARNDQLGLILALPSQAFLSSNWRFCLISDVKPPVGYASPLAIFDNPTNAVREATYYLIPGPIDQGRGIVYDLLPHTTWNFDLSSPEGWRNPSKLVAVEGGILTTELSPSAFLVSMTGLNIPGAITPKVTINGRTKDAEMNACLFFVTTDDFEWDADKSSCLTLTSGEFQAAAFNFEGNPAWKNGVIRQLRLGASVPGVIEVNSMKAEIDGQAWEFETPWNAEGWGAWNQLTPLLIDQGALSTRSTGNDPYMGSPVFALNAEAFPIVHIRMSVSSGDSARLYFITSSDTNYDEAKALQFPIIGDNQYHTYTLDLSRVVGWRGIITQIRLDPSETRSAVLVDFIRIVKP